MGTNKPSHKENSRLRFTCEFYQTFKKEIIMSYTIFFRKQETPPNQEVSITDLSLIPKSD